MAVLTTDFIPLNRGGTAGDGSTGTYHVATVDSLLNNVPAYETTTALTYNAATQALVYTDEDGTATTLDLSALTNDIYVDGASINGSGILTLTDTGSGSAGTPDITIDLSAYYNSVTDNQAAGTIVMANAAGSVTIQKTAWMSASIAP